MKNANSPGVKKTLCLLALLLPCSAALAETAAAEISRYQIEEEFRALDLNGDGYVSLAEAAGDSVIVQRFDKGDRNRDGKLSEKEFANLGKVKLRVAKARKDKEKEPSAAVGGSARSPDASARR
jgi:hypothetical protein